MFTGLGNIFVNRPRQAEHADARLDIKRHDPDERRRNNDDEDEVELFSTDDNTTVSVSALRVFLQDFLKTLDEEDKKQNVQSGAAVERESVKDFASAAKKPPSGQAAKAASAYQNAARSGQARSDLSQENVQSAAKSLGLSSDEVRNIHKLIEDLGILSKRGVMELDLEPSSSFVKSLMQAVSKAL